MLIIAILSGIGYSNLVLDSQGRLLESRALNSHSFSFLSVFTDGIFKICRTSYPVLVNGLWFMTWHTLSSWQTWKLLHWNFRNIWCMKLSSGQAVNADVFYWLCSGDEVDNWVIPFSWKTVYGPPPDMSLF